MNRSIPDTWGNYQVLIFDDNCLFLSALFELVIRSVGGGLVGTTSASEALALAASFRPGVILIDSDLPFTQGIKMIAKIRKLLPESTIIALTMFEGDPFSRQAFFAGANKVFNKGEHLERNLLQIFNQNHFSHSCL